MVRSEPKYLTVLCANANKIVAKSSVIVPLNILNFKCGSLVMSRQRLLWMIESWHTISYENESVI